MNEPSRKMTPPSHRYIPGTPEYEEALRTGRVRSSLVDAEQLNAAEETQSENTDFQATSRIISPESDDLRSDSFDDDESSASDTSLLLPSASYKSPAVAKTAGLPTRAIATPQDEEQFQQDTSTPVRTDEKDPVSAYKTPNQAEARGLKRTAFGIRQDQDQEERDESADRPSKRPRVNEASSAPSPTFEDVSFADIIGHGAVKVRIDEVLLPLGLPPSVAESTLSGIRSQPTSILLYGPPGTGKTQLARAIAGEAHAGFFAITPSEILSKFVGESEASIRAVFRKAKDVASQLESKCAIIFFDEIDALGQSRENKGGGEGEGCSRRVLAELLMQFNGALTRKKSARPVKVNVGVQQAQQQHQQQQQDTTNPSTAEAQVEEIPPRVMVVAATNRPEDCDPALMRRFGIRLQVGLPSRRDRRKMFIHHLQGIHHNLTKADFSDLAVASEDWSGSDIESLSREAAMAPIRENLREAAIQRRRESKTNRASNLQESQHLLLERLQNLRPVTVDDYTDACGVLFPGEAMFISPNGKRGGRFGGKRQEEHYDSSSDEDDDFM